MATHKKNGNGHKLVLGTRGSALALAQSQWLASALREAHPGLEVELRVVKTTGDADQKTPLDRFPGMGVFVKELQSALLKGDVDFAVHSCKDVPEDSPEALVLTAFPQREDARDAFISRGVRFRDLPAGAKVGTGSPRRLVQLRALRPDLDYRELRGNVDTRLRKVESGELDAVILAVAGLRRLGLAQHITHTFAFHEMVPAIGQGALAVECRANDTVTRNLLSALDDADTRDCVEMERSLMARLGGGCKVPMAAHAYISSGGFRMIAALGDPQSGKVVRLERADEDGEEALDALIEELMARCRDQGLSLPRDLPASGAPGWEGP